MRRLPSQRRLRHDRSANETDRFGDSNTIVISTGHDDVLVDSVSGIDDIICAVGGTARSGGGDAGGDAIIRAVGDTDRSGGGRTGNDDVPSS